MDFDALLRDYFDGTLSERELERFQGLIDRFPEYRAELLQTLELRSALHDDALTLSPPQMLVERVRLSVAGAFTAEFGDGVPAESEERRRGWLAPLRIAAGSMVAVCLAVGIALTPTIPFDSIASSVSPRAEASSRIAHVGRSSRPERRATPIARSSDDRSATPVINTPELPSTPEIASEESTSLPRARAQSVVGQSDLPISLPRSLKEDLALLLEDPNSFPIDDRLSVIGDPLASQASTSPSLVMPVSGERGSIVEKDRYRRLAIGVLVGSGQVAELTSLTALLQNSYYFAFGVNPHDRIGLEMGASAFERQERVPAPRTGGGFARPSLGSPESDDKFKEDGGSTGGRGGSQLVNRQYQQQITYGGVFYDRRMRLNEAWDLCGRVTFGGADNSVVGGVRAYAAYTPTANRNITLTLGIGGSGLYNLTDRDNNTSGNYGIYYGIETGF